MGITNKWTEVDRYITNLLVPSDPVLDTVLQVNADSGLPAHDVSPNQGKFLQLLAQIQGARTILEIGTLGGYSTIWLARALPKDGRLLTLEADPKHAEVARSNINRANLSDIVEVRLGPALNTLQQLVDEKHEPFDFIFIDADKRNNPYYLAWALKLSRPGTLIIGDNVVRDGAVLENSGDDQSVQGIRQFYELLATEPRVSATAIQTVGSKGYDGFALAVVTFI
ncbi:O-methyltransferase [Bacillus rhizoplanae]|uniref:O-methyltransferase n=1 Tax=Bacillus rhizoplanae TaxID=2880966 RepID=UPI003D209130